MHVQIAKEMHTEHNINELHIKSEQFNIAYVVTSNQS